MQEQLSNIFDPMKTLKDEQFPNDSITIVIKCGGRTYFRGINLEDTQEKTAKVCGILMQQVVDTVDAKGLKAGGSRFDPKLGDKK